jgi:hypothetical protein
VTYTYKLARRLAVIQSLALLCLLAKISTGNLLAAQQEDQRLGYDRPIVSAVVLQTSSSTQTFQAHGRLSDGTAIPVNVSYSATGGTVSSDGVYTAGVKPGTYHIIARDGYNGLADTAIVTITAPATEPAGMVSLKHGELSPTAQVPPLVRAGTSNCDLKQTPDSIKFSEHEISVIARHSYQLTVLVYSAEMAIPYRCIVFAARGGTISSDAFFSAGSQPGKYPVTVAGLFGGGVDTAWVHIAPSWLEVPSITSLIASYLFTKLLSKISSPPTPPSLSGGGYGDFGRAWNTAVTYTRGSFGQSIHFEVVLICFVGFLAIYLMPGLSTGSMRSCR